MKRQDKLILCAEELLAQIENKNLRLGKRTKNLQAILKSWLKLQHRYNTEANEWFDICENLTPSQRKLFSELNRWRSVSWNQLREERVLAWSFNGAESSLKRLRNRLDKKQWWFEIRRSTEEVVWVRRFGKRV